MSDNRRFRHFASFILEHYPVHQYKTVLDVAGGAGRLSNLLSDMGYQVTICDPKAGKSGNHFYNRIKRPFHVSMGDKYDFLVGMHPDGALEGLATLLKAGKPVAFVPCCNLWNTVSPAGTTIQTLNRFLGNCQHSTDVLPIRGSANVVYWK